MASRVRTNVGLSDFTIDLVLAREGSRVEVLLDGSGWSRRLTARDRDALPREILEDALGWPKVARVWLPDWLANRGTVTDRLVDALDKASARREADEERFKPWTPRVAAGRGVLDALPGRAATKRVRDVLVEIVDGEGPITVDRLVKLAANAFSLTKVSDTRRDAILRCLPSGSIRRDEQGRVVWPSHRDPATWTGYRSAEPGARRIEDVPLREIGNAMRAVVVGAAGMHRGELYAVVLRIFGLVRRTSAVTARLDAAAELAQQEGKLRFDVGDVVQAGT